MTLVTVVFSVVVDTGAYGINIDRHRLDSDDEYKENIQNQIKDVADSILQTSGVNSIIHECEEIPELVE